MNGALPQAEAAPIDDDLSVLMALWRGDDPLSFRDALTSATVGQTLRPAHTILTIDGPLTDELEAVVADVVAGYFGPATVVRSGTHAGLALTLDRGINACTTRYIARADADDLNHPERFEKQMALVRQDGLHLVGSHMREFGNASRAHSDKESIRRRPLTHPEITAYLRDHSPFHHPTVIVDVEMLKAAGGYRKFDFMEDYDLWHRMVAAGARTGNVDAVLVDYRVSDQLYRRRGGLTLLKSDVRLQRQLVAAGTTSRPRALRNLVGRAAYRLIPSCCRKYMYWAVIEKGWRGRRLREVHADYSGTQLPRSGKGIT